MLKDCSLKALRSCKLWIKKKKNLNRTLKSFDITGEVGPLRLNTFCNPAKRVHKKIVLVERIINGIFVAYVNKEKCSMNVSCFSYEEYVKTVILSAGVQSMLGGGVDTGYWDNMSGGERYASGSMHVVEQNVSHVGNISYSIWLESFSLAKV